MAPSRSKKLRSSTDNDFSARPHTIPLQSPSRTPVRSPQKKALTITEGQKQSLMDNLQLEVTERARKLRAQYALQAQSLRTRIELRINRIPNSLRKANMGELLEKYTAMMEMKHKSVPEEEQAVQPATALSSAAKTITALEDHETSEALGSANKENANGSIEQIPNPKKRTKITTTLDSRRWPNPSTVLSPKSANSRTLPQSPIKAGLGSPQKSYLAYTMSPLKPTSSVKSASPAKAAATAATMNLANMLNEKRKPGRPKTGTGRKARNPTITKAAAAKAMKETEDVRKVSTTSNASTGTTIVKNARKAPIATARKNDVGTRTTAKKVAAGTEAPPLGRRVLRKRA